MNNDIISREYVKAKMFDIPKPKEGATFWEGVDTVGDIIDNAPAVEMYSFETFRNICCKTCAEKLRPHEEWIPVSEKMPDKNMPCLVSVGKLNLTKIAMYSDLMETIDHKIFWIGDYGKDNFQNITEYVNAWQPLPKPYKKGGAE